jgi:hypothetical protein
LKTYFFEQFEIYLAKKICRTMTTQEKKKYKGGNVLRYEPQDLTLVNSDPAYKMSFEQAGCIRFCEKIQGYNVQLTKEFSMKFNGV